MTHSLNGPVFMSYSRRDEAVMLRIASFLRDEGIQVWVDNEKLIPGTPIWEEEVEQAIKASVAVVVVMSPDSKTSEWVRREISLADQFRKRIFPVLVRGDEESSITLRLITRQYVDFRQNEDVKLESLSAALSSYLGGLEAQEAKVREQAAGLKPAPLPAEPEAARTAEGAHVRSSSQSSISNVLRPIEIGKLSTTSMGSSLFWVTIAWTIGGASGGAIYWAGGDFGDVIGGIVGGAVGGFVTGVILRQARILSSWQSILWVTLAWAIGGGIGWPIGERITEAYGAAIGAGIAAAMGGIVTLRIERGPSDWKSIGWIILAWAVGSAIGWTIGRIFQFSGMIDEALGWAIGRAIAGAIGGYITGWQLLSKNNQ